MAFDFNDMVAHTCRDEPGPMGPRASDVGHFLDVSEAMKALVDRMAVDTSDTQTQIWFAVHQQFLMQTGPPVRGLSKNQVIKRVQNARKAHFGGDLHGRVEVPPLSKVKDAVQGFFQFHYTWHDDIKTAKDPRGIERVIGWAHPELRNLLRFEGLTWFIDGTFRCVPDGFAQCVTLMIYDVSTDLYVPVVFALTTSRIIGAYTKLLQCIEFSVGRKLEPKQVVCDFEAALIGAIGHRFPDVRIIGCLFHFKQACRRQLKKYRIPNKEAALAMAFGVLDVLTVVNPTSIDVQGISWVRNKIKQQCQEQGIVYSRSKWRQFWRYFRRTWMERFPPMFWNVWGINRAIVNRTNNPLERFHRELNTRFSVPHPSVPRFVTTIEAMSREYIALRSAVAAGAATALRREPIPLPRAPRLPTAGAGVESESSSGSDEPTADSELSTDVSDTGIDDRDEDGLQPDCNGVFEPDMSYEPPFEEEACV
jgi:hypothetical protein